MAARKAIILPLYFQDINWFLKANSLDRFHQHSYFSRVILTREGTLDLLYGKLSNISHGTTCPLNP
jgi:hypothetical protein